MNSFVDHLYLFFMLIPIVSVHEAAHAWVAHLLGDDTAKEEGRLTVDPLSHIDPWGTLIMPAINIFLLNGGLLGWGRPVPVNPGNLRHWRRDELLIALAGPVANLLMAFVAMAIVVWALPIHSPWEKLCGLFAYVCVFLAILNFFPVPPLDGWNIVRNLFDLPNEWMERGSMWGWVAVMIILNLPPVMEFINITVDRILFGMQILLGAGGPGL